LLVTITDKHIPQVRTTRPATEQLPPTTCPRCGQTATGPQQIGYRRAIDYESCLRKCGPCGLGFSNAFTGNAKLLTIIHRDPFTSLPAHISDGHERVLANSFNELNRLSKAKKFTFATSEDHVTWTVFRHLQLAGKLRFVPANLGLIVTSKVDPIMLLWGSPVPADDAAGRQICDKLRSISEKLREESMQRSEPDVILDFGVAGIILIEVKHRSPNDVKRADYPNWSRYLNGARAFQSEDEVRRTGMYELARNWRFAFELAGGRPFAVLNLGPGRLFSGEKGRRLDAFIATLTQSEHNRFVTATWKQFLQGFGPLPDWLKHYLADRQVAV